MTLPRVVAAMSSKTKRPRPETTQVFLMSDGYSPPRPTLHIYTETRPCVVGGPGGGSGYEFMFRCKETGSLRRYGVHLIGDGITIEGN